MFDKGEIIMASDKTDKKVERKSRPERERQGLRRGSVPDTKQFGKGA